MNFLPTSEQKNDKKFENSDWIWLLLKLFFLLKTFVGNSHIYVTDINDTLNHALCQRQVCYFFYIFNFLLDR